MGGFGEPGMGADLVCAEQGSCVQIQVPGICRAESPVLNPLLYPVLQQHRAGLVSGVSFRADT